MRYLVQIANYPFTTLKPNLDVCELNYRMIVFADVPGLLEGASKVMLPGAASSST